MCGFFKKNCLGLQQFLPPTQSLLLFTARSCGNLSSWHWYLDWRGCCGAGTPFTKDIPSEFLSTTCGCRTSPFLNCVPPTSTDGCGFFNSVVVRLPFNSISDGSEWWWFCILVLILLWLCEEMNHVCLCHHLDRKFHYIDFPLVLFSSSQCSSNIVSIIFNHIKHINHVKHI